MDGYFCEAGKSKDYQKADLFEAVKKKLSP